jgi:hypothetical protein
MEQDGNCMGVEVPLLLPVMRHVWPASEDRGCLFGTVRPLSRTLKRESEEGGRAMDAMVREFGCNWMDMLGIDYQAQTMGVYVFRTDIWWVWPTRLFSRSGDQVVCGVVWRPR